MDAIRFDNTYPSQNFKKMSFVSHEELADGGIQLVRTRGCTVPEFSGSGRVGFLNFRFGSGRVLAA